MQKMRFKDMYFILRDTKIIQNLDKYVWDNLIRYKKA